MTRENPSLSPSIQAVLFDLDGVLTPTAIIHEEAWRRLFSDYFARKGVAPYTDDDYFEHLDGRARYDAVAAILASRGIQVPYGDSGDAPDVETICGLGNRKNFEFNEAVATSGVAPYPGSLRFLDYIFNGTEDEGGARDPLKAAVVSSSKNAPEVLKAAGLFDHFPVIVDGNVAASRGLAGKPAPDTYLDAAKQLGVDPAACAVVEDAVSGVQAGRGGDFGMVIGVDRGAGADVLVENGATVVVADLAELVPEDYFPTGSFLGVDIPPRFHPTDDPNWVMGNSQFTSENPNVEASVLALTNGYLGIRGNLGLRRADGSDGTYLNGLHETWPIAHAEDAYGFARIGQSMVTLPDATGFDIFVNSVAITDSARGYLSEQSRTLDLHSGILYETALWRGRGAEEGVSVRIEQRAAVALFDPHLATIDLRVTPLEDDCQIAIRSVVETPALPPIELTEGITLELDDPRKANRLVHGAVIETDVFTADESASIAYQVRASQMAAALAVKNQAALLPAGSHTQEEGSIATPVAVTPIEPDEGDTLAWAASAGVCRGESLSLTKTLSYARDDLFEERPGDPAPEADAALDDTLRADNPPFFDRQSSVVAALWDRGDVVIELDDTATPRPGAIVDHPDEDKASIQARVRWCLFQLLQATACLKGTGVPAKGLTGSGYDGHYFWDAEIYVLPYLVYANPSAARQLLHYRYLTLDAARVRASEMSEEGALFPWRTIAGPESSAYYPAGTAQYHIDAAVSYAINQYLNATGDTDFLLTEAIDILVETSRMWLSLGFLSGRDLRFHIHGVTGPDEYTAVVNDNLYTNVMAKANLHSAARWLKKIEDEHPEEYEAVIRRLALSDAEVTSFTEIADKMFIPWNDALGLHSQDEAFLEKQVWDFEATPPSNYPLLLNYHPLVIYRHQVLKQSDTVLALYLLGSQFSPEDKLANFDYYDAITTGDSSLSAAAQSIVAAEVGHPELAADYFERLLNLDLADLHRNTDVGVHIASLGGTWSTLIMGFAGLRDDTGTLRFAPRLPVNWVGMTFSLELDGYPLDVHVSRTGVDFEYRAPSDRQVEVEVEGEKQIVWGSL